MDLKIRSLNRSQEESLIYSSFLKSFAESQPFVPVKSFYEVYHRAIEDIMADSESMVLVATLQDEEDTILGWVMSHDDCLVYVYVKQRYRHLGVARALCDAVLPADSGIDCLTITNLGYGFLEKHGWTPIYNAPKAHKLIKNAQRALQEQRKAC